MRITDELKRRGGEILADPRVFRLLQHEQVVRATAVLVDLPGRVGAYTSAQAERVSRVLQLPSADLVEDLDRRLTALEDEVRALRVRLGG